jgi:hypothetical protein
MQYFQSYSESIERAARLALNSGRGFWVNDYTIARCAVEALANIKLAEEDEQLPDPALVQCSDLYMRLLKAGACDDGLAVVGHQCDEDTLDRVFAYRLDWQRWYFDNILDEGCDRWTDEEPYPHFDTLDEVNA